MTASSTQIVLPLGRRRTQLEPDARGVVLEDYFGSFQERALGAQGFLVHVTTPQARIAPHFHEVAQYQVVVGGSGTLGKNHVGVGTVHFTDAYTPYGPVTAGPDGISFFTLRDVPDTGAHYMPESRSELPGRPGETFTTHVDSSGHGTTTLAETSSGARASQVCLQPDRPLAATPHPGSAYLLVIEGTIVSRSGDVLPPRTCIFSRPGIVPEGLRAGSDGATLAQLGFGPS